VLLVGIDAPDRAIAASLSAELARRLRSAPEFLSVANGDAGSSTRDRELLFSRRYVLSPGVTAERMGEPGLRAAIGESIDLLASPIGMMTKSLLPRDPTGEMIRLLTSEGSRSQPEIDRGVWFARNGVRALLLVETRAAGADTDGQAQAQATIRGQFEATVRALGPAAGVAQLALSGAGVFAVSSRDAIRGDVTRLSMLSACLVSVLLLLAYRSLTALWLGLLPVVSGALAGVAATSVGFGVVHGLTLGFGTTLIGEAVDYSIYFLVQSQPGAAGRAAADQRWVREFWPTIRLGVLTSVFGFATLVISGFPGLAQLGVYSVAGLIVAALVTRHVLPALVPAGFVVREVGALGSAMTALLRWSHMLRWVVAGTVIVALATLFAHRDALWNTELAALSPVSKAAQAQDVELRADLGAPDLRYLVLVTGPNQEAALQGAEAASGELQRLVDSGELAGFDSPARYLPSAATQAARRAALPAPDVLAARVDSAVRGLPLGASRLAPFLADVETERNREPLRRADLADTQLALAVDAMLTQGDGRWTAVLPLQIPRDGQAFDAQRIGAALAAAGPQRAVLVDMKRETEALYAGYLAEAIRLSAAGFTAIVALLLVALRAPGRVLRVVAPLVAAVVVVAAGIAASGSRLHLMHLIGMLLIVAVGSNYALFFDRGRAVAGAGINDRTLASLLLAAGTTVLGFGTLAFSSVPVLQAVGVTVGPGAALALLFAAVFHANTSDRS
jgi:predicted exporter